MWARIFVSLFSALSVTVLVHNKCPVNIFWINKLVNECIRIYFHFILNFSGIILRVLSNIKMAAIAPNQLLPYPNPVTLPIVEKQCSGFDSFMGLNCVRYSVSKQLIFPGKIRKSVWLELSHARGGTINIPEGVN